MADFFSQQFAENESVTRSTTKSCRKKENEKIVTEAATVHQREYHRSSKKSSFIRSAFLIYLFIKFVHFVFIRQPRSLVFILRHG